MYTAYRVKDEMKIDGKLDENAWIKAPKSPRFVDMISGEPALYDTRSAVLWDDHYMYIGFWLEEPFVTANFTKRDEPLFIENNVEFFVDGIDTYYELEINALNTIYEAFFIWKDAYKRGGKFDIPKFDVHQNKVSTFQGYYERDDQFWEGIHPRGIRWAFRNWDFPGLQTSVHVNGKINDHTNVDQGWTVELALPWKGMKWLANGRSLPPMGGDIWKFFFGRFEKLTSLNKSVGWSWDPTGMNDSHRPEKFTPIQFSRTYISDVK